ncbi:phage head-tail connector protein [Hathewaya histolytica]|uniref:phage head-tail connector protein n=1 Tax=Hathewaya histolytica TaxID=1498 RepID=UPI003B682011
MTLLDRIKIKLENAEGIDSLLSVLLEESEEEVKEICNIEVVPPSLIVDIAIIKYNRQGTEGSISESYSGVSNNFIDGYPDDIKKRLYKIRRLPR